MSMTNPEHPDNKNLKKFQKTSNNNIINIIINHTEPGVCITPEDGKRIIEAYGMNIAPQISPAVARMIEDFIAAGHTVDHVIDAIERTGFAPRPSPQYLRAVLRNYDQPRPETQPTPWYRQQTNAMSYWQRTNPALQYEQHEYRDEDFDGDAFMEEARRMREGKV